MLNPSLDSGIDSIFNLNTKATSIVDVPVTTIVEPPLLSATTLPPPPAPLITPVSSIPSIVDAYLANKMHEAVKTAEQVKEQVKAQVTKILPKIEKTVNEQLEAENLYKALVDAYESDKLILDTYGDIVSFKRHRDDEDKDKESSAGSNWGSKRRRAGKEPESTSAPKEKTSKTTGKSTEGSKSHQKSADKPAQAEEPMQTAKDLEEPAHQEFETGVTKDQPNEETSQLPGWFQKLAKPPTPDSDWNKTLHDAHGSLKVDTLTPELLVGPTFELMKGSCKSLVELEYFFEEVYKESARDVYSKRRIIAVTKLQIVEWHNYKHQDLIAVRRDDGKLYTFKEGYFNRLRIQDIEDMLLLLDQGKLTNLTVEERLAFNVSLRMFTRSVVIQRRMEDLQLGVESYQKKLDLTKLDTYRLDLKRKEAYSTYSNPEGFIYQNKDKKNRLMCIDKLHKFSNSTLNDVRTALDDHLKGIRMKYLPQTIWRPFIHVNLSGMLHIAIALADLGASINLSRIPCGRDLFFSNLP
ncbi:hypothetical protein Tco_0307553 [Tanacetum coccineum]